MPLRETRMSKILVVEDNEMNWDMLSRRLERKGYQVVLATDGQQGLTMAATELPDLILMDMSLPVLDGWEATRRLRADDITKHIPIIALTAHVMVGDQEKSYTAGCDDYETKPVDFSRLLAKIQAQLSRKITADDTSRNNIRALVISMPMGPPPCPGGLDRYHAGELWYILLTFLSQSECKCCSQYIVETGSRNRPGMLAY
jgi:CheY-like chemotaxis protein